MLKNNLINARKNKNLTQSQIAKIIGIKVRQYQNLEAGTSNGSVETWLKLKTLLNESIDYLLEEENE